MTHGEANVKILTVTRIAVSENPMPHSVTKGSNIAIRL